MPGARRQGMPGWIAAAALAAVAMVSWLPALINQARDPDVMLQSVAAVRANASGSLPYVAAWLDEGPLALGLYQLLFALAGPYNLAVVALVWLALALGTMWMVACLARRMGANGLWAAALFAVALPAVGGALTPEVPAAAAAVGAVLLWLRARRESESNSGLRLAVLAGVLMGVALLFRQTAGMLVPALVVADLLASTGPMAGRLRRPLAMASGFLALPLLTVMIYAALGHFETFLFCFHGYSFNIFLAGLRADPGQVLLAPWTAITQLLWPGITVAALAVAGMGSILLGPLHWRRAEAGEGAARLAVLLAALALFAGLFAGLWFLPRYFALALPFWAALAGWFVSLKSRHARPAYALTAGLLLVAALMVDVGSRPWLDTARRTRDWVTSGRILDAADPLAWPRRDGLATGAARYLREHSEPQDRVFVYGRRPQVLVYAGRVVASRFVSSLFLTGVESFELAAPHEGSTGWAVPGAWDLLMADLARDQPLFIVDASYDHALGHGAHSPEKYPPLGDLLARHYEKVKTIGEVEQFILWQRKSGSAQSR